MDIKQEFAQRLAIALDMAGCGPTKAARKRHIANAIGITERQAGNYLNGEKMPTAEGMIALARRLRVNSTWLIDGTEPIKPLTPAEVDYLAKLQRMREPDRQRYLKIADAFRADYDVAPPPGN